MFEFTNPELKDFSKNLEKQQFNSFKLQCKVIYPGQSNQDYSRLWRNSIDKVKRSYLIKKLGDARDVNFLWKLVKGDAQYRAYLRGPCRNQQSESTPIRGYALQAMGEKLNIAWRLGEDVYKRGQKIAGLVVKIDRFEHEYGETSRFNDTIKVIKSVFLHAGSRGPLSFYDAYNDVTEASLNELGRTKLDSLKRQMDHEIKLLNKNSTQYLHHLETLDADLNGYISDSYKQSFLESNLGNGTITEIDEPKRFKLWEESIRLNPQYNVPLISEPNFVENVLHFLRNIGTRITIRYFQPTRSFTRGEARLNHLLGLCADLNFSYRLCQNFMNGRRDLPSTPWTTYNKIIPNIVEFDQKKHFYVSALKKYPDFRNCELPNFGTSGVPPWTKEALMAFVPSRGLQFFPNRESPNSSDPHTSFYSSRPLYFPKDIFDTLDAMRADLYAKIKQNFANLSLRGSEKESCYSLIYEFFKKGEYDLVVNGHNKIVLNSHNRKLCDYLTQEQKTGLHYMLAISYLHLDKYRDAIKIFKLVAQNRQRDPDLFFGLSRAYREINNHQYEFDYLRRALQYAPKNTEIHKATLKRLIDINKESEHYLALEYIEEYMSYYEMDLEIFKAYYFLKAKPFNQKARLAGLCNLTINAIKAEAVKSSNYNNRAIVKASLSDEHKTLHGRANNSHSLAIIDNGRYLLTTFYAPVMELWDLNSYKLVKKFGGFKGLFVGPVLALPNNQVAGAGADRNLEKHIRIWDWKSGCQIKVFKASDVAGSHALAMVGNKWLAAVFEVDLKVWDINTWQCVFTKRPKTSTGGNEYMRSLATLSDISVATGGWHEGNIRIWDIVGGEQLTSWWAHSGAIFKLITLPGNRLVSCSSEVKIWDLGNFQCIRVLKGHTSGVRAAVALSENLLATGSDDKTVKIWDVSTGKCLFTQAQCSKVQSLAILPNDKLVIGFRDKDIVIRDINYVYSRPVAPNGASSNTAPNNDRGGSFVRYAGLGLGIAALSYLLYKLFFSSSTEHREERRVNSRRPPNNQQRFMPPNNDDDDSDTDSDDSDDENKDLLGQNQNETVGNAGLHSHYMYSVQDGYVLAQNVRERNLDYNTSFKVVGGETYASTRQNRRRIFLADPYYIDQFAQRFIDDINIIAGRRVGEFSSENNRKWTQKQMPQLIVIPILAHGHWMAVRVEIDYDNGSVDVLWSDPFGGHYYIGILDQILLTLMQGIQTLMRTYHGNNSFQLDSKKVKGRIKTFDQQGINRNGWDCGPITFSNIADYTKYGRRNKEFVSEDKYYTIKHANTINHTSQIIRVRISHTNAYRNIAGTNISLSSTVKQKIKRAQKLIDRKRLNRLKVIGKNDLMWKVQKMSPRWIHLFHSSIERTRLITGKRVGEIYTGEEIASAYKFVQREMTKSYTNLA